jgi:hypothetical protein
MARTDKQRPLPPIELLEADEIKFAPAVDLIEWPSTTFIAAAASLRNDDHGHLNHATIGAAGHVDQSSVKPRGDCLRREVDACSDERQILDWFGDVPDFILTFDAHHASVTARFGANGLQGGFYPSTCGINKQT